MNTQTVKLPECGIEVRIRKPGIRGLKRCFGCIPIFKTPDGFPEAATGEEAKAAVRKATGPMEQLDLSIELICTCCEDPQFVNVDEGEEPEGKQSIDSIPVNDLLYLSEKIAGFIDIKKSLEAVAPLLRMGTPASPSAPSANSTESDPAKSSA